MQIYGGIFTTQLYRIHISVWAISCKFAVILQNIYRGLFLDINTKKQRKQRYIDERICFIADVFRVLLCKHYRSILLSVKKFL